MRENLFEMGSQFESGWSADNKTPSSVSTHEVKSPQSHQLYLQKERRRGKIVTLVQPFFLEKSTQQALLKQLKKSLGRGGTSKDDRLEFQGEVGDTLRQQLEALGYRFRR